MIDDIIDISLMLLTAFFLIMILFLSPTIKKKKSDNTKLKDIMLRLHELGARPPKSDPHTHPGIEEWAEWEESCRELEKSMSDWTEARRELEKAILEKEI